MKTKLTPALLLFTLLAVGSQAQQATPNRIALVIGAQNYSVLPRLHNSLNDARAMTAKLQSKDFQVLKSANKSLNILLLDACRSLPSFTRDTDQGLTRMEAPQGSIIVFAAQAGKTASDGTKGANNIPSTNISLSSNSSVVKQEPVVEREIIPAPFDYGYGPSDAATVTVGSQNWISKNLNVDYFSNGEEIPEVKTTEEWKAASDNQRPAWCYYNNESSNGSTYGKLYNWYAVHDPRGLAPKGWHVPSDFEWDIIVLQLTGNGTEGVDPLLKSANGWKNENAGISGNGNNGSGIAGLPGGNRYYDGIFFTIGKFGYWWSSSEYTIERAWSRHLNYNDGIVYRSANLKGCGFSVRFVRD